MKIIIINYGLGNLYSVLGAIRKIGYDAEISNNLKDIESADKLILPGVGAFADGMNNLNKLGLIKPLDYLVNDKKKPILAICLGFQLLSNSSTEFGLHEGLGWINASVEKIMREKNKLRVPHVGWNDLYKIQRSELWYEIPDNSLFYYVHSYHMKCNDENIIIGKCNYGSDLTAAIQKDNIYGTQFHPEKSQLHGLKIIENFIKRV